jgi:hypothetical protein
LTPTAETVAWTCTRCEVTTTFMAGSAHQGLPADWADLEGELFCLGCRRVLAGEAAQEAGAEGATREELLQLRKAGTLEFELRRDPDRPDRAIARACHTSAPAVAKVRDRLA